MPQGTAFHRRTSPLNDRLAWADWWGYHAAGRFGDDLEIEYNAVREACGAIDVSPLFKYRISGPDAGRLIDRVITRDAAKLQPGQVYYTPWCDERGKLVDDGTVSALDDGTYRWTAAEPNYRWIRQNATRLDAHVEDISAEVAALALQGPTSRSILESATNQDWSDVKYFRRRAARIGGVDVDVTRTGYTGDLGYKIWVSSDLAVELWDALFAAGEAFGLRPVGMDALDVLRVEAGLILLDAEFTGVRNAFSPEQEYSPFELGLGRLVNFKKPRFVGRTALLAEQDAGLASEETSQLLDGGATFADSEDAQYVSTNLIMRWLESLPSASPGTRATRFRVARQFAEWLHGMDPRHEAPPRGLVPGRVQRTHPYIYSEAEIVAIIEHARTLPSVYGMRGLTCSTLFGLIAVTGLRISEALGLDVADLDVESGVLHVRQGKLGKERLLPLDRSVVQRLESYGSERDRLLGRRPQALFVTCEGHRLGDCGARYNFAHVCQ